MYPNAKGCDIARYQAGMNYEQAIAQDEMRFFFLKVCQVYPDPLYEIHYQGIKDASENLGIPVRIGGYIFVDVAWSAAYTDPDKAINHQLSLYEDTLIHSDFPVLLDIEGSRLAQYGAEYIRKYVEAVRERFGCPPCIYTAQGIWRFITDHEYTDVLDCPLWVANWSAPYPNLPYPWISWEFWQTGTRTIGGKVTDFNYFRGDEKELFRVYPDSHEPDIEDDIEVILLDHERRIRALEMRLERVCE